MSKRSSSFVRRDKSGEIKCLKRQLKDMQEQLTNILSSSSSSEESPDASDNESQESQVLGALPTTNQLHPLEPEITIIEDSATQANTNIPEQNITGLGINPDCVTTEGKPLHEEIVVRWTSYLLKGLTKDQRREIINKYKIPANCKALIPPQVNSEIQACLPRAAHEHDCFMIALQEQLAHGLSAVGTVLEKMLPFPEQANELKILADACQLFTNIHNAISTHRKFKIVPHLNGDCKKVAKTMEIDEFLFSKNFAEAVKNEQSMKKSSTIFKKKAVPSSYSAPGTSGYHQPSYLNYQRQPNRDRMKQKKERKPSDRYHKQSVRKYPYRK
ncbi:uncharacterized protein LOC126736251 [Anthonomus grandis grandis]|uniref:uncharacterized protein LOC126736251 n=1 Tax=Anthonomus grandis grandis TaxID=2921223 RepID=UPI002165BE7E|nr:uncharacterized protein LOC126736251 [Anthonomus grandis grandis]